MPDVKQYTMINAKATTADGQTSTITYKSEKQMEEILKEAQEKQTNVEITKQQTFGLSTATTWDEVTKIVPNDEVRLGYFNYGLSLEQHKVKKELMEDADWQPVDGVYDLLADVQTLKEKRVPDPLSASRRSLKALWTQMHPGAEPPTDEEINAVLASFAGQPVAV